ncbi:MAG: phosphatidylglycerophosphatase A [Chlorobium sp.]|uniref:phosphatidylglycerophosphatase A family protein n=1 Tax=Chlorobium sp. TaxID=1095 RepID=UPI0025C481EA|nr:phosphatidylglycerophosphatase A [Chlorobium sp.]MCF8382630.1 phosphatidylglycerophosphatase A [Chlorobium sp.]
MRMMLARALSTCLGLGYFPFAPGTVVSFVAVCCYLGFPAFQDVFFTTCAVALSAAAGVWSGGVMEEEYGEDPSIVTIDELAGQWLALAALPATPLAVLLGFLFFRFFDIAKPGPVDQVQHFRGGWGIMADDLLAGILANLSVRAVLGAAAFFQAGMPL